MNPVGIVLGAGTIAACSMYAADMVLRKKTTVAEAAPLVVLGCVVAVPMTLFPGTTFGISVALVVFAIAWTDGRELLKRWRGR